MLFPIKQKPNIQNLLNINTKKSTASMFHEIERTTLKPEYRKNTQIKIGALKDLFFTHRLKRWKTFTQQTLNHAQQKQILLYHNKNLPASQKFLKYKNITQNATSMYLPGFLTNFQIQKKQQLKTWTSENYIFRNTIKKNKPEIFLFFHLNPQHSLVKETTHLQLPILATEHIYEKQLSTLPLYINTFKNYAFVEQLFDNYLKQNATTLKLTSYPVFWSILQGLDFKTPTKDTLNNHEIANNDAMLNETLDVDFFLNNYYNAFDTEIWVTTKKQEAWIKVLKSTKFLKKLKTKKKSLLNNIINSITLFKKIKTKKTPTNYLKTKPTFFYPGSIHSYQYYKKKLTTTERKNNFQNFFLRQYNVNYLNTIHNINIGWKNKKIWQRNYWDLKWTFLSILKTTAQRNNFFNFSLRSYSNLFLKNLKQFQNLLLNHESEIKLVKRRIKRPQRGTIAEKQRITKTLKIPTKAFFWRANQKWIWQKEKKMRNAALVYFKLNKQYPSWWESPIKESWSNYKKFSINK